MSITYIHLIYKIVVSCNNQCVIRPPTKILWLNILRKSGLQNKIIVIVWFSVQFSSVTQLCPALGDIMNCRHQASLSISNSQFLIKMISVELVMPSNHLILCCPLLLLPLIFPSIRDFSDESVLCIRWPQYWSFNFSISPSNEYSEMISFRMDW